ncbi:MAG: Lrp/AsnC family transcriptional regulator [Firmicutes bacterium]|nr:Lrp/AsnC family transcriptional regulator [Bacillota bacterium]
MFLHNLDDTDKTILDLLEKDGRITYAEIARHTHLSRVAVRDRVKSLSDRGVISRFTVQVNAAAVGYNTLAFLHLSLAPGAHKQVAAKMSACSNITQVLSTTGATILHVQGFFRGVDHLNQFVRDEVGTLPGVLSVETHLVLENHKMFQCIV